MGDAVVKNADLAKVDSAIDENDIGDHHPSGQGGFEAVGGEAGQEEEEDAEDALDKRHHVVARGFGSADEADDEEDGGHDKRREDKDKKRFAGEDFVEKFTHLYRWSIA